MKVDTSGRNGNVMLEVTGVRIEKSRISPSTWATYHYKTGKWHPLVVTSGKITKVGKG